MGKPEPQKRKPIRDKFPFAEIGDNIQNDAVVTRAKARMLQNQVNANNEPDMLTSSSDEDDISEESPARNMNETYEVDTENRNRSKRAPSESLDKQEKNARNRTNEKRTKPQTQKRKNIPNAESIEQDHMSKSRSYLFYSVIVITFLIVGVACLYMPALAKNATENEIVDVDEIQSKIDDVKETLKSLVSKFRNQKKDLWQEAYMGIRNIIRNRKQPSIIVLVGNKSDPLDCLAVLLGNISSNALDSNRLLLTPDKFQSDMGSVIEFIREKAKDNKVIIIWDLLNINTEALKAFHNLCDRINPLVEDVIYIITIISDGYDKAKNPLEFVQDELFKKLSGTMKQDAIQPLITRITDGFILTVNPEPSVIDCPLPKIKSRV